MSDEFIPSPPDAPRPPLPRPDPKDAGVKHDVAEADKVARTGSSDEKVRNTPPAGAWNDTATIDADFWDAEVAGRSDDPCARGSLGG